MRSLFQSGFILVLAALSFSAGPSTALTIIANSGLDGAVGCTNSTCFGFPFEPPVVIYNLSSSAPLTGSFGITGSTLDFDIDLAAANLIGPDGAVTSVDFTGVNYLGSVSVVDQGLGNFSIASQTATISGTLTPNGAGGAVAFNLLPVTVGGSCIASGNVLQCFLLFGGGTAFEIDVNGNQRYFRNSVDVTALVPEPGTGLLLGLGLSIFAAWKPETQRSRRPQG